MKWENITEAAYYKSLEYGDLNIEDAYTAIDALAKGETPVVLKMLQNIRGRCMEYRRMTDMATAELRKSYPVSYADTH